MTRSKLLLGVKMTRDESQTDIASVLRPLLISLESGGSFSLSLMSIPDLMICTWTVKHWQNIRPNTRNIKQVITATSDPPPSFLCDLSSASSSTWNMMKLTVADGIPRQLPFAGQGLKQLAGTITPWNKPLPWGPAIPMCFSKELQPRGNLDMCFFKQIANNIEQCKLNGFSSSTILSNAWQVWGS